MDLCPLNHIKACNRSIETYIANFNISEKTGTMVSAEPIPTSRKAIITSNKYLRVQQELISATKICYLWAAW